MSNFSTKNNTSFFYPYSYSSICFYLFQIFLKNLFLLHNLYLTKLLLFPSEIFLPFVIKLSPLEESLDLHLNFSSLFLREETTISTLMEFLPYSMTFLKSLYLLDRKVNKGHGLFEIVSSLLVRS